MAQIIMMAKEYGQRPSSLMEIEDSFAAYCFDEVCYMYYGNAHDAKGKLKWNLIAWDDKKKGNNEDLMEFIVKHSKK